MMAYSSAGCVRLAVRELCCFMLYLLLLCFLCKRGKLTKGNKNNENLKPINLEDLSKFLFVIVVLQDISQVHLK